MNSDQLEGKWKQLKGSVRERWGKFTDDDLEMIAGKRDSLIGKIQERYGNTRQEAEREADEFYRLHDLTTGTATTQPSTRTAGGR